ncbi:hypothetical protein HPB47_019494, partial [Ixodes persulcatus]
YEVEGTSITPEDLQEGVWESVFRRQMNAHAAFVSKRQKEKATQEAARTAQQAATPLSTTPPGKREMDPAKPLKGSAQKRRPTLSRLPMEDIKVVFRPRGFDPVTYGASTLMMAILQLLPPLQSRPQEKIRIHPTNRTFTVSTPAQDRARRLGAATSLTLGDRTFQVSAYVAMPENSTRIVVPEDTMHGGDDGGMLLCYPYREKIETCFNCRQTGHRADVCRQATSNKCRSCGTEHSNTNPDGSTYSCKPVCIICGGEHETGTQVCPHRFVQRKKTPALSPPSDRKFRRRSRSRRRGAESLRSRDHSRSSTSHPGSKGRTNQQQQRQDDPRKVSWASRERMRNPQAESNRNPNTTPRQHGNHNREGDVYHAGQSIAHTSSHDFNTTNPHERRNGNSEANLHSAARTDIHYHYDTPSAKLEAQGDRRRIGEVGLVSHGNVYQNPKRRLRLRDRVARREERIDRLEERMDSLEQKEEGEAVDLGSWTRSLQDSVRQATDQVPAASPEGRADAKLLHMWQALERLRARWSKQKHNRSLRKRISRLERDIETYAIELDSQHWGQICDQMNGKLGLRDTWGLLRHLMDPQGSKTVQRNTLTKVASTFPGDARSLIEALRDKYVNLKKDDAESRSYSGIGNPALDADILEAEVRHATTQLNTNSAPGPDGVMEHVVLNRLRDYMEDQGLFPDSMFGFRQHLSTQDILLQLQSEVIEPRRNKRVVVGLDLHRAFDNIRHTAVLSNINNLGLGERFFAYVQSFLENRTIEISVAGHNKLATIPRLGHSIYADDITLWTNKGSDADMEETLQTAIDVTYEYVANLGLKISPHKSEQLIKDESTRLTDTEGSVQRLDLRVGDQPIPGVRTIRILGLIFHSFEPNTDVMLKLHSITHQTVRLIRRISNRRGGVKEADIVRLIKAFVESRFLYSLPYLQLRKTDRDKCDLLLRSAYKSALGLPPQTPTVRLMALGLQNTVDELLEAHRSAQMLRLGGTRTGRVVLKRLGIPPPLNTASLIVPIPTEIRSRLRIPPLPRNMNPTFHIQRRKARAEALHKLYAGRPDVYFVDAANYSEHRDRYALAVVDGTGRIVVMASVKEDSPNRAEEAAIGLALNHASESLRTIICDSKTDILSFSSGRVSRSATKLLTFKSSIIPLITHPITLIWSPAHEGVGDATRLAGTCGAVGVAIPIADEPKNLPWHKEPFRGFHDITQHYRLQRQIYPPPHKHYLPELYKARCTKCYDPAKDADEHNKATIEHIFWSCPADPPPPSLTRHLTQGDTQWTTLLLSSDCDIQLAAVTRAEQVAARPSPSGHSAGEAPRRP